MRPFFLYFGGKWRIAPRYPKPRFQTIIEPFAGAAGYATRYPDRNVILVDAYPVIAGIWRYLIRTPAAEIRALPLVDSVDDLPASTPQEARWLIGFWMNQGTVSPCRTKSAWIRSQPSLGWGPSIRERIARQVDQIRHWQVIEGPYYDAPPMHATWFVDPPYQVQGVHYRAAVPDFYELGDWCYSLRGQVMVCENVGADWLPFEPFLDARVAPGSHRARKTSAEALWMGS